MDEYSTNHYRVTRGYNDVYGVWVRKVRSRAWEFMRGFAFKAEAIEFAQREYNANAVREVVTTFGGE